MPYLTLTLNFGGDQPPTLEHVSVGLQGNAPPEGTLSGSTALHTAALDIFNAATADQQEALKQAALQHLKDLLP